MIIINQCLRYQYLSCFEHLLLVIAVESLHQLLLVPLEVVEEDPDGGGGDLGHVVHLLDALHHVSNNILCAQYLQ